MSIFNPCITELRIENRVVNTKSQSGVQHGLELDKKYANPHRDDLIGLLVPIHSPIKSWVFGGDQAALLNHLAPSSCIFACNSADSAVPRERALHAPDSDQRLMVSS